MQHTFICTDPFAALLLVTEHPL